MPRARTGCAASAGGGAARLVRRYRAAQEPDRPAAWLTYHLYYKAPDWLGPAVAEALRIPYLVAEASHAPKRAGGRWAIGHDGAEAAIRRADAVIGLSSADTACVTPLMRTPGTLRRLAPFIDTGRSRPKPTTARPTTPASPPGSAWSARRRCCWPSP